MFDASTFSQHRRRRFDGIDVAQPIFDCIVEQALAKGPMGGEVQYSDSTHLKANANKGRFEMKKVAKVPHRLLERPVRGRHGQPFRTWKKTPHAHGPPAAGQGNQSQPHK